METTNSGFRVQEVLGPLFSWMEEVLHQLGA